MFAPWHEVALVLATQENTQKHHAVDKPFTNQPQMPNLNKDLKPYCTEYIEHPVYCLEVQPQK